jgi:putative ABC transport system permease protein
VLAFTALLAAATGILVGILPAWQASRGDLVVQLSEGSRGASCGRGHSRARAALVASELALALMLLVFASLLLRSFSRVLDVDPGFSTKDTLVARVWLPQPNIPENGPYFKHEARVAVLRDTLRRLSALPGVRAVGSGSRMPLDGSRSSATFNIEGKDAASNATTLARGTLAGPGYFEALGIPVMNGRAFDDGDDQRGAPVAVVNESFARRAWPGEDPIGKHLQVGGGGDSRQPWLSVVGIVRDTRADGLESEPRPEVFRSQLQASSLAVGFVLRADRPEAVIDPMRRAVQAVDPDLPVYAARSLQGVLAATLAQRRFAMTLVALFAATALLLCAIGVYGVMAESVQQRRREIGVRMALGAAPSSVARLVVNDGLRMAALGAAIGVAGALVGSRLVAGLLFGIRPSDPVTFAAIPALLLLVAALACWLPARRAARLDPLAALRED